jgi:hypothetical protein
MSSIAVFEQRELEKDQALLLVARAVRLCAQDHIPFHRTGWPQLQLPTLIGMVVQAWITYTLQMFRGVAGTCVKFPSKLALMRPRCTPVSDICCIVL